ncbi:MAG: Nif3-like dinuclear metal center hexameric protein [Pirellulales bacterium]
MATVNDIAARLEQIAPLSGAEDWDNVGLLVGERGRVVRRLMTCLTLTPTTVSEALDERAELVVVHHPIPFRPLSRLTTDTTTGRLLWQLIGAGISVYSAHTAFDSAGEGINEQWAAGLGLTAVEPLVAAESTGRETFHGAGRCGELPSPRLLAKLAEQVKALLSLDRVRVVGDDAHPVRRVALACGSGGSFLEAAQSKACDCLITGETNFHTCLEAEANRIGLILCGHFASEHFAMLRLADVLAECFPDVTVWGSRRECDPIREL